VLALDFPAHNVTDGARGNVNGGSLPTMGTELPVTACTRASARLRPLEFGAAARSLAAPNGPHPRRTPAAISLTPDALSLLPRAGRARARSTKQTPSTAVRSVLGARGDRYRYTDTISLASPHAEGCGRRCLFRAATQGRPCGYQRHGQRRQGPSTTPPLPSQTRPGAPSGDDVPDGTEGRDDSFRGLLRSTDERTSSHTPPSTSNARTSTERGALTV
jgi:hypothetical protein